MCDFSSDWNGTNCQRNADVWHGEQLAETYWQHQSKFRSNKTFRLVFTRLNSLWISSVWPRKDGEKKRNKFRRPYDPDSMRVKLEVNRTAIPPLLIPKPMLHTKIVSCAHSQSTVSFRHTHTYTHNNARQTICEIQANTLLSFRRFSFVVSLWWPIESFAVPFIFFFFVLFSASISFYNFFFCQITRQYNCRCVLCMFFFYCSLRSVGRRLKRLQFEMN